MRAIVLTQGDPRGVGPELLLRAAHAGMLASPDRVIADPRHLNALALRIGTDWAVEGARAIAPIVRGKEGLGQFAALEQGTSEVLSHPGMALVTAPIDKDVAMQEGLPVPGHTEYLAQRCGGATPLMVMVGATMRVALLTTHLPLRQVADHVTTSRVVAAAEILIRGLRRWFGIERPRIAILGLNPHAGEGGRLGLEERDHIEPAIVQLRALHTDRAEFHGPLPADSAFVRQQRGDFDAVLAMYHDQGLGPFKLAHFHDGVNATFGLPFVRTSPDHGTAVGLEGRGIADPTSLFAAIRLAREVDIG